ncbi:PLP-dependent aminotransferase family protein [Saccharothrix variisporea]|uniref:L-histidine carboxy-lyase (Histamine-forming) n=1 Tax=Saccharothrix variisporea TaxID=543527 RepID=A0A495XQ19_9PSEU|nr:pyridoxal-dependent decarboxylase [Saccharothrix variisporea]RKT74543.1 L-histidine carboxy-lyase (histamine-forming) [Saccharothrix variisporea]
MTITDHNPITTGTENEFDTLFALTGEGLPHERRKEVLTKLKNYFTDMQSRFLGYQTNQDLRLKDDMAPFLDYHFNNVGDPFAPSHFTLDARAAERAVLAYYARLWHAKPREYDEHGHLKDRDAYWGYVLTMGSSEGNNYALWNARDYLSGKTLMVEPDENGIGTMMWVQDTPPVDNQNAYSPVAFYSQDTHYSVAKALRVLDIPSFYEVGTKMYPHANPLNPGKPWDLEVPSTNGGAGPGSIDVDKLVTLVEFFARMGHPVLINLNYGSTFKGAYDDVETICRRLTAEVFTKYGLHEREVRYGHKGNKLLTDKRTGYWIHIDGALGATYGPFLERAVEQGKLTSEGHLPKFDFRIPEVCSIVTSGHKYPGAPWPCGIFMTKAKLQMQPPAQPAVIGSPDTTFGGSRNAFSPLIMWNFLARNSEQAQVDMITRAEEIARYAYQRLSEVPGDWEVARTPYSLTVRFRQPTDDVVHKYSLATVPLRTPKGQVDYAHLYVMPHVTKQLIDDLAEDLVRVAVPAPRTEQQSIDYIDGTADSPDIARLALVHTWNHAF